MSAFRGQGAHPVEEVRRVVDEVLSRPEFSDEASWWERLAGWIGEALEALFDAVSLPDVPDNLHFLLWWLLALLSAMLLGWAFVRFGGRLPLLARRRRAAAPIPRRAQELRLRARSARAQGDLSLALRLTFFALVVGLGRRGDLDYRDAWTNRELLARGHPAADVSSLLGPLVDELDRKMFGSGETTEADVDRLEALCTRWLGSREGAA